MNKKEINEKAILKFEGNREKNKGYNFKVFEFKESDNLILVKNIELDFAETGLKEMDLAELKAQF